MIRLWDYLNDVAAPPEIVKKLAELALAGMEAEPVYWQFKSVNGDWLGVGKNGAEQATREGCEVRPLYTASQPLTTSERAELDNYRNPQQVVPDFGALTKLIVQRLVDCGGADDNAIARCEEFVYNACRAAMLQGADGALTNEDIEAVKQIEADRPKLGGLRIEKAWIDEATEDVNDE